MASMTLLAGGAPAIARKSAAMPTGLRGIEYGRPAPDFPYDAGSGTQHLAELAGRTVVVHFWATWCKPCMEEMPLLSRLREKFGDRLEVVTLPWHDSVADARERASAEGWTFPVAADVAGSAVRRYGIEEVPTTIIVAPDFNVSYVSVGEASWDELATAAGKAIGPPAAGAPSIDPPPRL
jgi:thiol-disulfide isomerase/thioredoxin